MVGPQCTLNGLEGRRGAGNRRRRGRHLHRPRALGRRARRARRLQTALGPAGSRRRLYLNYRLRLGDTVGTNRAPIRLSIQRHGGGALHASIEPRALGCEHDVYSWGALMSAGFIFGLPVAILYDLLLGHLIRGLTATGTS